MNKSIAILSVLLVCGAVGIGIYFVFSSQQKKHAQNGSDQKGVLSDQTMKQEPTSPQSNVTETPQQKDAEVITVPQGATAYVITEANAQYSIEKAFFKKASITVVGKTSFVSGNGWYDAKKHSGAVSVLLNSTTVKSDIAQRDKDIDPLFVSKDIMLKADFKSLPALTETPAKIVAPVKLTVNNITKEFPMTMMIALSADGTQMLSGEGSTNIKMSDFSIVPPSRAGVFTVPDDLTISFTMKASPKEHIGAATQPAQ